MELRQRPYFPLYVQDFLADEKLAECSAESTGVYIRLLCIMHKSDEYGSIRLKEKDKKYADPITNFALKLMRQMPYIEDVIERSLAELIEEGVVQIDGDRLFQKRMVRDGQNVENKVEAGRKGGRASKTQAEPQAESEAKAKQNLKQNASRTPSRKPSKSEADCENEYETEIETDNEDISINNNIDISNSEEETAIADYNRICPELPPARQLTDSLREAIRERGADLQRAGKSWTDYFHMVHDSDFLSGRNGRWTGCNLGWLLKPNNMAKVLNGSYANRAAPAPVESLWEELQAAAKKMAGLYSPYACIGSGDERHTPEEIEEWKRECWDGLPEQLQRFVGSGDELAAIGRLDARKREQTVLPRLRRFLG